MQNLPIVSKEFIKKRLDKMTQEEMEEAVKVTVEFERISNTKIREVMTIITELDNDEVGVSNKVLCAGKNINHWEMIAHLHALGWLSSEIEPNALTYKGFVEMNDAKNARTMNIDEDRLVLQNYNGALYWNKKHENYSDIMEKLVKEVKEGGYNEKLKQTKPPMSRQTMIMLQDAKVQLLDKDGIEVKTRRK